jgi:hypothetical protein
LSPNLMKDQDNPDGIDGHNERNDLREIQDNLYPHKQKFTGHGRPTDPDSVSKVKRELAFREMTAKLSAQCVNYVYGCSIDSCEHCKKRGLSKRIRKDTLTLEEQGQELIKVGDNGKVSFVRQKPPHPLEKVCRNYKLGCTKPTCGFCGKFDPIL